MNRFTGAGQHFGSRIAVAEDGNLFFTIGDRGQGERSQDPDDHAGSVLRIAADGSIPADNPFVSGGGAPEIWSTGHRNPQGLDIDPQTGQLYAVEHGARGGDEVNLPKAGRNYGWPVISYGRHYSGAEIGQGTAAEGMEQPIHYWDPSIAPGGTAVYRGEMFPEWDGDLLVAALKFQLLVRLDLDPKNRRSAVGGTDAQRVTTAGSAMSRLPPTALCCWRPTRAMAQSCVCRETPATD